VLAIASEVASDCEADALVPVLHSELQPFVNRLCADLASLDGEQGDDDSESRCGCRAEDTYICAGCRAANGDDDTNAHGFYDTYTTDAAW